MDVLPLLAFSALLGILVGLVIYVLQYNKAQSQQQPDDEEEEQQVAAPAGRRAGGGVDRMRRQMRQRHAVQQQQQQRQAEAAGTGSDASDEEEEEAQEPLNRREQRRADRAEERAAEAAAREARSNKINAYDERRRGKEADREAREKAQEEEVRRAAEEKQKAEDEEAAKWMNMISVEQTGTIEEQAAAEDQGLLGRFIDYIQQRKMVPIEDAATEFGLRSSEVVDRIQGLEAMGRITGVMDERGKFIYISRPEMEAVAAYIRTKGRISISALAQQSSDLIDLEARAASAVAAAGPGPAIDFDALAAETAAA